MIKFKNVISDRREIVGILITTFGFLLLLGLFSYDPLDVKLYTNNTSSSNWIGLFGAYSSCGMLLWFGVAGYMIPFCVMLIGISSSFWSTSKIYPRLLWFLLATFCLSGLADMSTQFWYAFVDKFEIGSPGGLIGDMLANRTLGYLIGKTGTAIIFFVLFVISIARMLDLQIIQLFRIFINWIKNVKKEPEFIENLESKLNSTNKKPLIKKPINFNSQDLQESEIISNIVEPTKPQRKKSVTKKVKSSDIVEDNELQ